MTVAELEYPVKEREQKVANLEQQLEHERMIAGIKRGLDEVNRGLGKPLQQVDAELRTKYNIPRP